MRNSEFSHDREKARVIATRTTTVVLIAERQKYPPRRRRRAESPASLIDGVRLVDRLIDGDRVVVGLTIDRLLSPSVSLVESVASPFTGIRRNAYRPRHRRSRDRDIMNGHPMMTSLGSSDGQFARNRTSQHVCEEPKCGSPLVYKD